ncbi:MAG TPA: glycosyltransferase family 39 protein [Candidatus Moranbacteria bacterium]|nr:glycosyltransferase family 39 protein [Candidatus Moranbacteria bacterium]HRZ33896.1 glycosyltransferase family 39 protein [Candidatus Moranbacteria bacterium]
MKQKIIVFLVFFSIFISSLYFGFPRLEKFSGVDEPYWSYDRVPKFWNAIKNMKWEKTHLCDKPGIVIAAISGIGLPFDNEDFNSIKKLQKIRYEKKTLGDIQRIENLYFHLRLPVFLFTLSMLPIFYFLIKKLLGQKIAIFSVIFIGLSPILLGISLIINSDAMLWILAGLSILSFFNFLKDGQKKFLILSGFLLGLSVINKFVANILFVYFFSIFLMEYFLYTYQKTEIDEYLKKSSVNYLILFGVAIVSAFLFFPATWEKIYILFKYTVGHPVFSSTWPIYVGIIAILALDLIIFKAKFSKIIFGFLAKHRKILIKTIAGIFLILIAIVFLHVYAKFNFFNIQEIIASPKGIGTGNLAQKYIGAILADTYSLIFSISPLVLFFLIFSVFFSLRKKNELDRKSITKFYILIFILIFYMGAAVNEVIATVRYQIMVYPLVFVLAAIGVSEFLEIKKIEKYVTSFFAIIAIFAILEGSLFFIKPNFLAYASEILPKNFIVNLKGMGEGSYEATQYLNQLPNAGNMVIWSDKGAVCERFVGKCFVDFKIETFLDNKLDYFIISTDRRSRTVKLSKEPKVINGIETTENVASYVNFEEMYQKKNVEFETIISNNPNNFVKVIKNNNIL